MLLAVVVGSGIMAERLSGGSVGLALLCNTVATGGGLIALILTFGQVSGAHFNPAVTPSEAVSGALPWRAVPGYIAVQITGAALGVACADLMFDLPPWTLSAHVRTGAGQWLSEAVATFGLIGTIIGVSRRAPAVTPFAVAAWIVAAYWCTASTSFANPAVTVARALTDTFAGIRPADVPGFLLAQTVDAAAATGLFGWMIPILPQGAPR